MKTKFCKILLAVSFLFLVSDLCMSQKLKRNLETCPE